MLSASLNKTFLSLSLMPIIGVFYVPGCLYSFVLQFIIAHGVSTYLNSRQFNPWGVVFVLFFFKLFILWVFFCFFLLGGGGGCHKNISDANIQMNNNNNMLNALLNAKKRCQNYNKTPKINNTHEYKQ